jgi:hypothetical protein
MDLDEQRDRLEESLYHSQRICPPDEYQYRQRRLLEAVAEFLLLMTKKDKEEDSDDSPRDE